MKHTLSLGTIVSFQSPKIVSYADLKKGLAYAGLSEDLARELLPQNAFKRACRDMAKNRVIDVVQEDKDSIHFQFTKKEIKTGYAEFSYEQIVTVNKKTGRISASDYSFQSKAQSLLDNELSIRRSDDINRLVHKVFDENGGDLIKIRPQGGAYFVPQSHAHLIQNLTWLMNVIGGVLVSYEIGGESETTKASIAQNMYDHFQNLIRDFKLSCEALTVESADEAKERRQQDILVLRTKLEAYKDLMQDMSKEIRDGIDHAETEMHQRIFEGIIPESEGVTEATTGGAEHVEFHMESGGLGRGGTLNMEAHSAHVESLDLSGIFSGLF